MALVRHPNLQRANGHYAENATVTAITNRDTETAATAYVDEAGSGPVSYPVTAGSEGELDIWVPVGAYETTFGDDTVDTPAVWEALSGEELANMLTTEDIEGFPDYVFSPLTYGGDPTGTADSTTAIQDAIDAAAAVRGTVHFGNGTAIWKFSSQLTGASGIRLTSAASGGRGGAGTPSKAKLRYTGTGSTAAILFQEETNVEIDHLHFDYNNTGFTGYLLNIAGSSGLDAINYHIHHCGFNDANVATLSATALLRMNRGNTSTISECSFNGAADNLLRLDGFMNGCSVRDCLFLDIANETQGQLLVDGSTQAFTIQGCVFEAGGPAGLWAIRSTGALNYSMSIENCWFGDNSGDLKWISGFNSVGTSGPIHIKGCYFSGQGTTGRCISAGDSGGRYIVEGCRFLNSAGGVMGRDDLGQGYSLVWIGNSLGTGDMWQTGEGPSDGRVTLITSNYQVTAGNLTVGAQGGSGEFKEYLDGVTAGDETMPGGAFIMGGTLAQADAYPTPGDASGLIYRKNIAGDLFTVIQSDTQDAADGVVVVTGTTPGIRFYVNGNGAAVNGKTPPATVPTAPAAASDPATTMSLVNDLRTKLIAFGVYGS